MIGRWLVVSFGFFPALGIGMMMARRHDDWTCPVIMTGSQLEEGGLGAESQMQQLSRRCRPGQTPSYSIDAQRSVQRRRRIRGTSLVSSGRRRTCMVVLWLCEL